jgi:DNA processing protein
VSGSREISRRPGACSACQRRCWLLGELAGPLEYIARDRARLIELLSLDDELLIAAAAGRRRAELDRAARSFASSQLQRASGVEAVCRHRSGYPKALGATRAPLMLNVRGGAARLARLSAVPCVAILGASKASDYGMLTAHSIARGLASAGVTVIAGLQEGIARAALAGVQAAGAGALAVSATGLGAAEGRGRGAAHARVSERGCVVSELPCDCGGRRWGQLASERIIAALAAVTLLVEADGSAAALAPAQLARAYGRTVAAVPGRVSSQLSRGPHALLIDGAKLVRGPGDLLELLHPPGAHCSPRRLVRRELEPRLRETLSRVSGGCDTPDRLTCAGTDPAAVLLALSELELMGLLARGDGGRYVAHCEESV